MVTKIKLAERVQQMKTVTNAKEAVQCVFESNKQTFDATILVIKPADHVHSRSARILEADTDTIPVSNLRETTDNVIYVKPDAIFGIVLVLFITFITYIGVMCLYGTPTPNSVPRKQFKFGREM